MNTIQIKNLSIGPRSPLALIAGPCVLESLDLCRTIAERIKAAADTAGVSYIFKGSFDKANRSSIRSSRGPGMAEGLDILRRIREEFGVPVTTDIHDPSQAAEVGEVVDIVQIPAFLCRQTDLLVAAAATGKAVNVKKGQFLSPAEMSSVIEKLTEAGADKAGIILTERGTFFGYNRLVNDFIGVGDMMTMNWPVCFDATHSTQLPGGSSAPSESGQRITGGRPEFGPMLARCAVIAGVQAIFIETHPDPARSKSDSATIQPLETAAGLVGQLAELRQMALAMGA